MAFSQNGAAALADSPFHVIRTQSISTTPDPVPSDPGELGDLVRRLEELVRVLRARDAERRAGPVLCFGTVEVEPMAQTVRRDGERVSVTRTEFRLLYELLRRPDRVVRREELRDLVWGAEVRLRSRVIDTHIARLRQKLERDAANPRHILTVTNLGYRFDPRGRPSASLSD
ncbi:MAG: response regulator transcription factor [Gemmatimonadales bacterium]